MKKSLSHSFASTHCSISFLDLYRRTLVRCGSVLRGVNATTQSAAFHLLQYFGAIPVNHRSVSRRRSQVL